MHNYLRTNCRKFLVYADFSQLVKRGKNLFLTWQKPIFARAVFSMVYPVLTMSTSENLAFKQVAVT